MAFSHILDSNTTKQCWQKKLEKQGGERKPPASIMITELILMEHILMVTLIAITPKTVLIKSIVVILCF